MPIGGGGGNRTVVRKGEDIAGTVGVGELVAQDVDDRPAGDIGRVRANWPSWNAGCGGAEIAL